MISKYVQRKLSSLESAGDRYPNLFLHLDRINKRVEHEQQHTRDQ